jgi:hypothetical protein
MSKTSSEVPERGPIDMRTVRRVQRARRIERARRARGDHKLSPRPPAAAARRDDVLLRFVELTRDA